MSDNPFEGQEQDELGAFLDGIEENAEIGADGIVTIRSSNGGSYTVPVSEPTRLDEVLSRAELAVSPSVEYWVNGTRVTTDFVVAPGATITAVGMVKGG